jgi:NAD(P)H-dependent FMN reductase
VNDTLRLAVIVGSTRDGRIGADVGRWAAQAATDHGGFVVDWIDLADVDLGDRQSAAHPRSGRYTAGVAAFAARIEAADAFLIVTPEYNHGYPAALKHALDAVYAEWGGKAAAFVSYGGMSGGLRAVEQLRQVLAELQVATTRDGVSISMAGRRFDGSQLRDDTGETAALKRTLDQLHWWGAALADARRVRPYGA